MVKVEVRVCSRLGSCNTSLTLGYPASGITAAAIQGSESICIHHPLPPLFDPYTVMPCTGFALQAIPKIARKSVRVFRAPITRESD